MADAPLPLVCKGRPVGIDLLPVGNPCGRRFWGPEYVNDGNDRPRLATVADQHEHARAANWAPDGPMCPDCRHGQPDLTRPAPADRTNHVEGTTL